jgi:4-hydroxybenzoate polyprenyltransferase
VSATKASRRSSTRELSRFLEIQNLALNLPFVLAFTAVGYAQAPSLRSVLLVVIAFLAARNAGHSFNRYLDRDLDAANPRTRDRALVTGRYSPAFALTFAAVNGGMLLVAAYLLNPLAGLLGPVALALIFGYSYTKRFTALTTVFLGVVEAMVPAGVFIAFTGGIPLPAWLAVAAVLLWGTAFETVHSLGDAEADQRQGLRSIPIRLGDRRSLGFLAGCHASALLLFGLFGWFEHLGPVFLAGWAAMAVATAYLDLALARSPAATQPAFRGHFVLGALFLAATIGGLLASHSGL